MAMFSTYKRWRLKDGGTEAELIALVRAAIAPHYRLLAGCHGIGLLRIEGSRCYLATQTWDSRAARDAALAAPGYAAWWAEYQPALAQWDVLMDFEDEWETLDLLS
jgi:hypothetical protein